MPRLAAALILFGCCHVAASDTPPPTAARYVAKVKFMRVDGGKQIVTVETEVTGTKGTPLKADLSGEDGLILKLEMRDLPSGQPTQYLAQFRLTNGRQVLSAPTLVTTTGRPAKLTVGQEKGDRIEVDLVVGEIGAASSAASGQVGFVSCGSPRIIIQGEEEEKLPVAP